VKYGIIYENMSYVFFDIECASVNKTTAKICAFGYVVCDEKFNIIKKEDILINPRGGFHLTGRNGQKGLVLPYSYSEFKKYPPFKQSYNFIKSLLEDKNNVILGHSILNDVKYLNLETKRFHLPSFDFQFFDSQLMYMSYSGDFSHQSGLESIAVNLGVEFTPHRAVDDAYATMRVVEAICKAENCTFDELIKTYGLTRGRIKNYNIYSPSSSGIKTYNKKMSEEKRERSKKRIEFFNYVSRKKSKRGGKFSGKIFSFSRAIEDDVPFAKQLCDEIYAQGGRYSHHLSGVNFYICDEGDDTQRTVNAQSVQSITVTDVDGLRKMLNETS
ncbi:MAG: 3'-5' exonuclease, partial [Clostridia bacterium]|nr:3'-5' exonuclease [Clostridia bacterium]